MVILQNKNHQQPSIYPLIDDVGGFPFPEFVQPDIFNNLYWQAYRGIAGGFDVRQNRGIKNLIYQLEESFKKKIDSGLEIVNYPQLGDMCTQFLKPIDDYEKEPFLIEPSKAKVIEVELLKDFASRYFEETGSKVKLKVCVTGPLELYQRKMGFAVYKDMAINLAKSAGHFIKNSIVNEKYMETAVISGSAVDSAVGSAVGTMVGSTVGALVGSVVGSLVGSGAVVERTAVSGSAVGSSSPPQAAKPISRINNPSR